jgi:hypothetical protein
LAEPSPAVAVRERPRPPQRRPARPATPTPAPAGIPPAVGRLQLPASGGEPLAPRVAATLQASLGVDVSAVRVHTDTAAAEAAQAAGARAFTVGNRIFLGRNERATDLTLIAHEVAHAVQQRGAVLPQPWRSPGTDRYEQEAHQAAAAVTRSEPFTVRERTRPTVQRLGLSDALDYFADKANLIPGFRMFTVVLGVNPINMSRVERSPANVLRAVIELLPGGGLITQALDNHGIVDRVASWVEQQIRTLGMTGSMIGQAIDRFLDSLSWRDIFDLGGVWERAKRIFTEPIGRLISFGAGLVAGIVRFIKDAILRPLARLAEGTRGYDLLKAVLGRDPITGEPVPQTAEALIGGFMKLIGQEEVWENIRKANAIGRAWAWFRNALGGLLAFVRQIPTMFLSALQSLELMDIVVVVRAFAKVAGVFVGLAGRFFSWAGEQVMNLLQIIFEVVAPAVMPYIRKAMGAFREIIRHPVRFIGQLVRAGVQGFRQFADKFLDHLRAALIGWLTGTMGGTGIYIPQAFELKEIVKFVLSVLALTWDNIRGKLVRAIGETAVKALETGLDIVVTLVTEGPAAAWEKIREQLSNLREMVMEQIMTFVRNRIVVSAITKLVSSLNPAGAFIQAIIAIYNTVMFVVERLRQLGQVVASYIDSISAIASGAIGTAANRIEQTMAGLLTLVISFLARLVGLGKVSDVIVNIISRLRAPIDRALDKVVEWVVTTAKKLGRLAVGVARGAVQRVTGWLGLRRPFRTVGGASHTMFFRPDGQLTISSEEMSLEQFLSDLATKYAGDKDKLAQVRTAQGLVAEIRRMTAPGAAPAAASPAVDTTVAARVDQLGVILREIGDGVSSDGATAGYRGLHWWMDASQTAAEAAADPTYQANLARQELGAQQLSDAVRSVLERTTPLGTAPTQADVQPAIDIVNERMRSIQDATPYVEDGRTHYDRFHFLLGRYVTRLQAVRARFAAAARLTQLDPEIVSLQQQLKQLAIGTREYYETRRRLRAAEAERASTAHSLPGVYKDLAPDVTASPFVATSLSARRAAQYALGSLFTPAGKARRLVGRVGRMLVFVASKKQLIEDGTVTIDELARARRIEIRKGFSESELTFTGSIPGEYLKATLEVEGGQSEDTVASSATGRAMAEGQRYGGLLP